MVAIALINNRKFGEFIREVAITEARGHFNKDQAFRFWASSHGGVYVPIDERTQPNQYLKHVSFRDIKRPDGLSLTLMNPSYMIRQMSEEYADMYGIIGHITSLNPLRPENMPDEWEGKALTAFGNGVKEVMEFTMINEEPFLRLIRPMTTKDSCLKCHAHQGYKKGDIHGGVAISLPIRPLAEKYKSKSMIESSVLAFIWSLGVILLFFYSKQVENAEKQQRKLNLELNRTNIQLEIAIFNANEMAKKANAANDAKSMFLANVTHELRTPLNAVIGYAQLLEGDQNLTNQQLDNVKIIYKTGAHLLVLINNIIDFSKIGTEKLDLEMSEFQLREFLWEIIEITQFSVKEKGLEFRYELQETLPMVISADRLRLRQLILNLLSNAIKFTDHGYCSLLVNSVSIEKNKVLLTITVEDSGVGITKEMRRKIFDVFEQSRERLNYLDGPGLGLSMCKQLIYLMGGELHLVSPINEQAKGSGSRFYFDLEVSSSECIESIQDNIQFRSNLEIVPGEKRGFIVRHRPVVLPPDHMIERIINLSRSGDVAGILEAGKDLELINQGIYKPLSDRIIQLANKMEIFAIEDVISKHKGL